MPPPTNGPAGMFLQHINQYLCILPLITVTILVLSVSLGLIDFVLSIFDSQQLVTWLDLSYPSIRHSFQGQLVLACQAVSIDMGVYKDILYQHHLFVPSSKLITSLPFDPVYRMLTYPLVTPSLSLLLTNLLFLVPILLQFETLHGTVPTLWILVTTCTVVPAVGYIVGASLLYTTLMDPWRCAGLSGWAIGLSIWTAVEEYRSGDAPDRMLFGVVRIPSRYLPVLIFLFYTLLVPGSSLILHIAAAGTAYLLATRRLQLTPSLESYRRLEALQLLGPMVGTRGFVSVNQDRAFLPIFRRAYADDEISASNGEPSSSSQGFPGQGQRLGGGGS